MRLVQFRKATAGIEVTPYGITAVTILVLILEAHRSVISLPEYL